MKEWTYTATAWMFAAIFAMAFAGAGQAATFEDDLAFLEEHTDVIVLEGGSDQTQVAVVPEYQGRVMTSTAQGGGGISFGWINRELIASGELQPHINAFGGEDRFWLGPEGGQFAIFFEEGDPFDLEHWQTPAVIDSEPYPVTNKTGNSVAFRKTAQLTNYVGTEFKLQIDREIRVLDREQGAEKLGAYLTPAISMVAYESENAITNTGRRAWEKETGLLSIWILGMFAPSPDTTVVIPIHAGSEKQLGPSVNDAYFGEVPEDRLKVLSNVIFFKGDGQYRSKIGVPPKRAKSVLGSYDARHRVLTIVQYNKPENAEDYVNSMWEFQEEPYDGDVANAYNDGPPEPGADPLGPFYELETSSPAADLEPGGSITHVHRTFHIQGPEGDLNSIAAAVLGIDLGTIKDAFK